LNGNPAGLEGQLLDWDAETRLSPQDPPRYPAAAIDQVVVDWQLPAETSIDA
jgi:hypothetical protein